MMVLSKNNHQLWLQFFDLKFLPQQHLSKKKMNVWMLEVLQLVFILAIIISKYIASVHVKVFHIDINILKIIVFNWDLMNLFIHIEVIGIKYFEIYLIQQYYYCSKIINC
jgi:hypothetical protein